MSEVAPRQRSLVPMTGGGLEGWMDEDAAAAAGQLFGDGPRGMLVIDARELLTSTARVVGAQLGALHFKTWMALITLHVVHGMPEDGKANSTLGELTRLIYGTDGAHGGKNTRNLLRAFFDLYEAQVTIPAYDLVNQRPADGVSNARLLIDFHVDDAMLDIYQEAERQKADHKANRHKPDHEAPRSTTDRHELGKQVGGKGRGTIAWTLHPQYSRRLAETDLRRFDWAKAQQLSGVATALWMVFTSSRVPYRPLFESREELEIVEVPLTVDNCHALGVRAATDAARRRTLNAAGERVCAADKAFEAFEAHGGRGRDSFLRVVRRRSASPPLGRPFAPAGEQMLLAGG